MVHEENFNLAAEDEYVVKFTVIGDSEELGKFTIYNPNVKEVCAIYGSPYYTYTDANSISVFALREETLVPGASTQPARESSCIKRVAYTMSYGVWREELKQTEEPETILGISDEIGEKVLPKTGKVTWTIAILLVVDAVLWYSWSIYESKNTNSRLRTKSSKNAKQRGI